MRFGLALVLFGSLLAQSPPVEFVCPMDPDVRSTVPGKCPRCGMALRPGIPDPAEYTLDFHAVPARIPAGEMVRFEFAVRDPKSGRPVKDFETVHEKLFHLFVVSQDLGWFAHLHPEFDGVSRFHLDLTLPKPGTYRLIADFYPKGGSPQFIPRVFSTAGHVEPLENSIPKLQPDLSEQRGENITAALRLEPEKPIAGTKTMLFLHLSPAEGLEPYIGAWAHMLAVSDDGVDALHEHPFVADGGPDMQFNVFFPRAAMYRVWVQFQRKGVVNTVAFTIPVSRLQ